MTKEKKIVQATEKTEKHLYSLTLQFMKEKKKLRIGEENVYQKTETSKL